MDPVENCLALGGLVVQPPLLLAPMAGLGHSAFRRLLASLGGVGLFYSEMLPARSLPSESPQSSPFLLRSAEETPLSYQLLVSSEQEVAPALSVLHALGADGIDINFGCPAPLVRRRGGGSRLMEQPDTAKRIVREARRRTALPLSAKIRLGEKLDESALLDFARMLEGEGMDWVTVHARLRAEPYGRPARWEWVGKVKRVLQVPVVANGGIFSVEDARRCLEMSGCDALMIGRGAVIRPWLFAEISEQLYGLKRLPARLGRPELFRRYAKNLLQTFPESRRLGRLIEFVSYFSQTYFFGHTLASEVQNSPTFDAACERAEWFFQRHDPEF